MFVFWSSGDIYGTYVTPDGFESITDVSNPVPAIAFTITPNPLAHSARIALSLSLPGRLRASVLDLQGRVVRQVVDQDRPAGPCEITFDGLDDERRPLRSGVYFLRISTPSVLTTKAFVVAR